MNEITEALRRTHAYPTVTHVDGVPIKHQRARGVTVTVVACKEPALWVVRGICVNASVQDVFRSVARYTGTLDPDLEWTYDNYHLPSYLAYGSGEIPDMRNTPFWPSGVYRFDRLDDPTKTGSGNGTYSNAIKIGEVQRR